MSNVVFRRVKAYAHMSLLALPHGCPVGHSGEAVLNHLSRLTGKLGDRERVERVLAWTVTPTRHDTAVKRALLRARDSSGAPALVQVGYPYCRSLRLRRRSSFR